jgi:phosphoribosylaminoimidazole carboxylase PurE protein
MSAARVAVVCGSTSDLDVMDAALGVLDRFGVPYERFVTSAHRSPVRTHEWAQGLTGRGVQVVIAGAGMSAHLAGVLAAELIIPVIGVPIAAGTLGGLDALLSTVQMPPGVPVATVGIGAPGARNAALLAVQILALADAELGTALTEYKADQARRVAEKATAAGL